jgi:hypothetical protein
VSTGRGCARSARRPPIFPIPRSPRMLRDECATCLPGYT